MQLSVRDVSRIFQVPESRVFRWVHEEGLPSREADGQQYFNRAELLEWAAVKKIRLSRRAIREWGELAPGGASLAAAIREGGVMRIASAASRADALQAATRLVPVPDERDRTVLLDLLLAREEAGGTNIAEGIALPHPRRPCVLAAGQTVVLVAYLDPPVDFGGADGQPVHTMILLISPTIRSHLAMLARVAHVVAIPEFRALLQGRGSTEALVAEVERIEGEIQTAKA